MNPDRAVVEKEFLMQLRRKGSTPVHLLFVAKANEYNRQMEELHDAAGIFKSHPDFKTSARMLSNIFDLLKSNRYTILKD